MSNEPTNPKESDIACSCMHVHDCIWNEQRFNVYVYAYVCACVHKCWQSENYVHTHTHTEKRMSGRKRAHNCAIKCSVSCNSNSTWHNQIQQKKSVHALASKYKININKKRLWHSLNAHCVNHCFRFFIAFQIAFRLPALIVMTIWRMFRSGSCRRRSHRRRRLNILAHLHFTFDTHVAFGEFLILTRRRRGYICIRKCESAYLSLFYFFPFVVMYFFLLLLFKFIWVCISIVQLPVDFDV